MPAKYRSTREALAWLFSCSRGKGYSINPLAHAHEPRAQAHRNWLDLAELHRLAFSDEVGLRRDTVAYTDLREWSGGDKIYQDMCGHARRVLQALRRAMIERRLLEPPTKPPLLESIETDADILVKSGVSTVATATPMAEKLRTVRVR